MRVTVQLPGSEYWECFVPTLLYTIYSPPNHPDGTVHKTKAEAEAAEWVEHR